VGDFINAAGRNFPFSQLTLKAEISITFTRLHRWNLVR